MSLPEGAPARFGWAGKSGGLDFIVADTAPQGIQSMVEICQCTFP